MPAKPVGAPWTYQQLVCLRICLLRQLCRGGRGLSKLVVVGWQQVCAVFHCRGAKSYGRLRIGRDEQATGTCPVATYSLTKAIPRPHAGWCAVYGLSQHHLGSDR